MRSPSRFSSSPRDAPDPLGVVRWLPPAADPVDQATVFGWLRTRPVPGLVRVQSSVLVDDRVELREAPFEGFALGPSLPVVHAHVTTAVALGIVRDAALAVARLHDLDRQRPPVHGGLGLADLYLTAAGEVRIGGVSGLRGDVQTDVRALLAALRELLRPKAEKPGGAQLLERLSALRFDSAHELYQTIESHLQKQGRDRLQAARARFTASVLSELGGPRRLPRAEPPEPTPAEPIAADPTRPAPPPASSSSERARHATEPSARPYRGQELPVEATAAPEETTVQTDEHVALQAALREAFPGEGDRAPPAEASAPFFDPDSTEALDEPPKLDPSPDLDDPWLGPTEAQSAQPTALLELDLDRLASAARDLDVELEDGDEDDPFQPEPSGPPPRPEAPPPPRRPPTPPPAGARPASSPRTGGAAADERAVAAARDALLAPAAAREEKATSSAVLVGNYRVVAAIGKGGMGEIYLARSTESSRLVALKVLGATESGDDEALDMLMDEAAIMGRIEHPHVLKVVDFGRAHGRYYLATEYLEGRPLVRVMIESYDRDGGMDHAAVAWLGAQAARGLHAAHTATTSSGAPLEVVHRDVSPQNIFVTYGGQAKVIDFGVARATERFSRTQVGLVKGKAAYMSPEQAEGQVLDARSDVFSLGTCLWEMIAGQRLFKRNLDYDTLVAVQTAAIEPPTIVRGRKDPELDQIILSALQRDLGLRTPSAEALADALEGYARARGVTDGEGRLRDMMTRLFAKEADRERELVRQLEERSATEEEIASLRELSGVSHSPGGREITLVGAPEGLGVLDRYGEGRREVTGEQVIEKVKRIDAERRSGEHPAQEDFRAEPPGGVGPSETSARARRGGRWVVALVVALALALGAAILLWRRGSSSAAAPGRLMLPEGVRATRVERPELVRALAAAGAEVSPPRGPVQRVEGLEVGPLMLDGTTRARRVVRDDGAGWLIELTAVDGGPSVVWLEEDEGGLRSRGLSVNDCPARARVGPAGVEVRYGAGSARLPPGGGRLTDVVLEPPAGATRVEIRPLGIAFGDERAGSGFARCPSGWSAEGRVAVRRLPMGRYTLTWRGGQEPIPSSLTVTRAGASGPEVIGP